MIKKFRQYIKENKESKLEEVLSKDDIEDQFLRLREVFDCELNDLSEHQKRGDKYYIISVSKKEIPTSQKNIYDCIERSKMDMEEELIAIKNRMESQYPVSVKFVDRSHDFRSTKDIPTDLSHKPYEIVYLSVITMK
jgi:hypothetical protein